MQPARFFFLLAAGLGFATLPLAVYSGVANEPRVVGLVMAATFLSLLALLTGFRMMPKRDLGAGCGRCGWKQDDLDFCGRCGESRPGAPQGGLPDVRAFRG